MPPPDSATGSMPGDTHASHDDEDVVLPNGTAADDEVMQAIAALGIMKRGGSSSGSHAPSPALPQYTSLSSTTHSNWPAHAGAEKLAFGAGPASGVAGGTRTHSTSRSASTTSHDSFGEWSQSGVALSTAASSPQQPASVASDDEQHVPPPSRRSAAAAASGQQSSDPKFISRVSQLPVISGGLEWYGQAKANSRVVKYGAGLVESSFNAVSRPITNNLQLGPLDDFACRQLDRFQPTTSSPASSATATARDTNGDCAIADEEGDHAMSPPPAPRKGSSSSRKANGKKRAASTTEPPRVVSPSDSGYWQNDKDDRMSSQRQQEQPDDAGNQQQVAVAVGPGRSRWQTVLVEAGGLGAAVSEESLKSLRYCLQWLMYATAHLDHQISTLREFIVSLQRHSREGTNGPSDALVTASASAHLAQIKHDVVETIRKVVDVVSKYAGAALPEQAKRYVRQSILGLPVKWATAIDGQRSSRASSVAAASEVSTPRAERMEDPTAQSQGTDESMSTSEERARATQAALQPTEDAAERVLSFAVESLDMLRSVTSIFGESIQKAEDWIERLRVVGLDRQRQRRGEQAQVAEENIAGTKRRRAIAGEADEDDQSLATASGVDVGTSTSEAGSSRRKRGPRSRESSTMQL
ncbi:transcriptional regulator opi1 [Microbotryomycetes sp. JL201]|nr:transcriptional regulator opi1 [Microbotryomycetes sp. JL201]